MFLILLGVEHTWLSFLIIVGFKSFWVSTLSSPFVLNPTVALKWSGGVDGVFFFELVNLVGNSVQLVAGLGHGMMMHNNDIITD